jgi:hypothetical protein
MTANFARNKTTLAQCLGISRTLLYEYLKLPSAPVPRHDGRWSVQAFRKFIAANAKKVKAPNEAEALKIQLLRIKAERESHELAVARDEVRTGIHDEYRQIFSRIIQSIFPRLRQMTGRLSPKFEGMGARDIKRLWDAELQDCFNQARLILEGKEPGNKNPGKVVAFREEKAVAA